jgi:hypothetical protein
MKVLFLDFDGVVITSFNRPIKANKKSIENLNDIVKRTSSRIVISSTWRYKGLAYCENFLIENGYKGPDILDITPLTRKESRGKEIKSWLDNWSKEQIESFAILDDDTDMKPFLHRLIHCPWVIKNNKAFASGIKDRQREETITKLMTSVF